MVDLHEKKGEDVDARFRAIVQLTELAMSTGDFDPVYPMLRRITKAMDTETALWFCTLYVAHYNLASGAESFSENPEPVAKLKRSYPIRFQRRNLRVGQDLMDRHIAGYIEQIKLYGSLESWLTRFFIGDPEEDFKSIMEVVPEVFGNGRWAGMKLAEVYGCVEGIDVKASDMGHRGSAAPRKGLGFFYRDPGGNSDEVIALLDAQGEDMTRRVSALLSEEARTKWDEGFGVAEMETNLCDFKSMASGKFYAGKCADVVLHTMTESRAPESILAPLWEAREALFDKRVLGEFSGWTTMDPSRDRVYSDHGRVIARWEEV